MGAIITQQELYDLMFTEVQNQTTVLTDDTEGAILDVILGALSVGLSEISRLTLDEFSKTYFDSADGPEVTGGPDDLQTLAVDHFGDEFERPAATKATGVLNFSRPTAVNGACTIPAGTSVSTDKNANGVAQRVTTTAEVVFDSDDLVKNAEAEAEEGGIAGNCEPDTLINLDSTLTDPTIVVTNDDEFSGGEEVQDDAAYRVTIKNLIRSLKGATLAAIQAAAQNVSGVSKATAIENMLTVIEYDEGTEDIAAGAEPFKMPFVNVFVADPNGEASTSLLASVLAAINRVRAAGVKIATVAAEALEIDWAASLTLNPSGPNYAELSIDATRIAESMVDYIADLEVGDDFIRTTARLAILAIWGPDGTNDISEFIINTPIGDVAVAENEKLVPGTVEIT